MLSNFTRLYRQLFSQTADEGIGKISKKYIARFLPKNPTIVEAGAHSGVDTVEMAKRWHRGIIYAFEPVPQLYTQLVHNTTNYKNVHCIQCALSDKSGRAGLYVSSGASDGSSSLLPPKDHLVIHPDVTFQEQISVSCITIDEWAEKNLIKNVDFLWLDLQGYELPVLRSSPRVLSTVKVIYAEVMLIESYTGNYLYKDIKAWLTSLGFSVQREEIPWSDSGNVLFIR